MNCETVEPILAAYVTGEATEAERAAVEAHLLDCASCRAVFAQAKTGWEAAAGWTVAEPQPELHIDIPMSSAVRFLRFATAMAAAVFLVAALYRITSLPVQAPLMAPQPRAVSAADAPVRNAGVGVLMCVDPETRRPVGELSIKALNVGVEILDGVAQTTVEEVFTNESSQRLEGTFVFPLPPDASITRLAMEIDGKLVEGECVEREKARATYEGIVRKMKDPALLEWMPGGLFKCRVFPIEARSDKRIIIGYQQALESLDGRMQYVYPLVSDTTRDREIGRFTVSAGIKGSAPVTVSSPSREIVVARKGDREATATIVATDYRAREDVVLNLEAADPEFVAAAHREGEGGYIACFITPRPDGVEQRRVAKETIFLVDCSASVTEPEMRVARQAVEKMIGALSGGTVLVMGHNIALQRQLAAGGKEEALRFLPTLTTGGACDLGLALYAAMLAAPDGGEVIYVGKGAPTFGETDAARIIEKARAGSEGRSVAFRAVAVGSRADRATLGAIANAFGGGVQAISPSDDVDRRVAEIARTVGRPALTDVKVAFEGGSVTEVSPAAMGSLYFGERAIVTARYTGSAAKVVLTGRVQGREIRREFPLALPAEEKGHLYAKRLWAQRRVADLLALGNASKAEVTALGVSHQLMTPYTSFLVLESEKAYEEHAIQRTKKEQEELVAAPKLPKLELPTGIDQAQREIQNAIRQGERFYAVRHYEEAIKQFEEAESRIKNAPDGGGAMKDLLPKLGEYIQKARDPRARFARQMEEDKRRGAEQEARPLEDARRREIVEKIAHLLELSYMSFDQRRFDTVSQLCDEILAIDPRYVVALELKEDAEKARLSPDYYEFLREKITQWKGMSDSDNEAVIPYAETVRFLSADEWRQISERTRHVAAESRFLAAHDDFLSQVGMDFRDLSTDRFGPVLELHDIRDILSKISDFPGPTVEAGQGFVSKPTRAGESFDLRAQTFHSHLDSDVMVAHEEDPEIIVINRKLDKFKLDMSFEGAKLDEIINYIRDSVGLNIVIDPSARDKATDIDKVIQFKAKDLPVKTVLKLLLSQYGLDFCVGVDNVILITAPDLPARRQAWTLPPNIDLDLIDLKAATTLHKLTGGRR